MALTNNQTPQHTPNLLDASQKNKYIIAAVGLIVIAAAIYFLFIFQKGPKKIKPQETTGEVKTLFDLDFAKRPYVTLTPTSDGAEIIISVEKMSEFDRIEYELTYLADNPQIPGDKITRGSTGTDVNPKDPKYKKSILLGTASTGVRSPDRGIADGKLILHLFKGDTEYQSETVWNMQEAGISQKEIKDTLGNFTLQVPNLGKDYWFILADTVGVPETDKFEVNAVSQPVYGVFTTAPEPKGQMTLDIKYDNELTSPKLYTFDHADSLWQDIESTYQDKTVSATVSKFATFVIVSQ